MRNKLAKQKRHFSARGRPQINQFQPGFHYFCRNDTFHKASSPSPSFFFLLEALQQTPLLCYLCHTRLTAALCLVSSRLGVVSKVASAPSARTAASGTSSGRKALLAPRLGAHFAKSRLPSLQLAICRLNSSLSFKTRVINYLRLRVIKSCAFSSSRRRAHGGDVRGLFELRAASIISGGCRSETSRRKRRDCRTTSWHGFEEGIPSVCTSQIAMPISSSRLLQEHPRLNATRQDLNTAPFRGGRAEIFSDRDSARLRQNRTKSADRLAAEAKRMRRVCETR